MEIWEGGVFGRTDHVGDAGVPFLGHAVDVAGDGCEALVFAAC